MAGSKHKLYISLLVLFCLAFCAVAQNIGDYEVMYEFVTIEYDWPNPEAREAAIASGDYIPENNIITGIKLYDGEVYVTVSRWLPGVPSTMNKIIERDGQTLLQPFPNWEFQDKDRCNAFQFTQSMEIDPETGYMWIIDVGRLNIWLEEDGEDINNCPAKLFIYDIPNDRLVHTHIFAHSTFSYVGNFLNDIVIDNKSGFAYMSDVGIGASGNYGGVVVYDYNNDRSWRLEHPSMGLEEGGDIITINGTAFDFPFPEDGIALSPDREHLFYCPLGGFHHYYIPAAIAQNPPEDLDPYIRDLGPKVSQTDGIVMGHKRLYFGAMALSAIYAWEYAQDMEEQGATLGTVEMVTQTNIATDLTNLVWPDTFGFLDPEGWLWSTPNRLPFFSNELMDYSGESGSNFRIVRTYVDDYSYLYEIPE